MASTFFFYDLETSGLDPRKDRIMQFAGQRTDMKLQPVGDPINVLVELANDTLPSPYAIFVTGITPQQTREEGYSEADFAKMLLEDVFTPDTIVVGYNSVRFDDEFIRHLFWRTFRDPYEWSWRDGRSRWDILDVVRMTRALRPNGIEWPVDEDGKAVNKLELLTKVNGLVHEKAHDALSDVEALIDVTRLIRDKQPKLFEYLLKLRDKKEVQALVNLDDKRPFVYSSGRYAAEFEKTTIAFPLTAGRHGNVIVYDLRHDPTDFIKLSEKALAERLFADYETRKSEDFVPVPVKELAYNKCPAVAPLGVLAEGDGWKRIGLDEPTVARHQKILLSAPEFAEKVRSVYEARPEFAKQIDAEAQLYDGFVSDRDKLRMESVVKADRETLADMQPTFDDERLSPLLLRYKARNFPNSLSADEKATWEEWRSARLQKELPGYLRTLQTLAKQAKTDNEQFLIEELKLWAEYIVS